MNLKFLLKNSCNLIFKKQFEFEFDKIPIVAKNLTFKKRFNLIRIGLNRLFSIAKPMGYPYMAHIDPAGICNLKCFNCPVHLPEKQGKCVLSFENYKKFIDECGDYLLYVILWSWGEPLLNPEFSKMVSYAKSKNIYTVTSTNLNKLSKEEAQSLIASGLTTLIIALDGPNAETYEKLREGGKFDKFMENFDILMEAKKSHKGETPFINLRMVVSKENEYLMEDFKKIGYDKNVDMISFKAYSTRQSGCINKDIDEKFSPDKEELKWYSYHSDYSLNKKLKQYNCKFPWTKPMLFADGTISSCEFDFKYNYVFGNIEKDSFKNIWFSESANKFRKQFLKNRNSIEFCKNCVYDYTLIPGCVLSRAFPNKQENEA